jgi:hypothetical protein
LRLPGGKLGRAVAAALGRHTKRTAKKQYQQQPTPQAAAAQGASQKKAKERHWGIESGDS